MTDAKHTDNAPFKAWLWPDSRAPKVSILRDEHNQLVNAYYARDAAAPALLEALQEAIDTVQGLYDPADDDDPAPAVLARWRKLVREARGQ